MSPSSSQLEYGPYAEITFSIHFCGQTSPVVYSKCMGFYIHIIRHTPYRYSDLKIETPWQQELQFLLQKWCSWTGNRVDVMLFPQNTMQQSHLSILILIYSHNLSYFLMGFLGFEERTPVTICTVPYRIYEDAAHLWNKYRTL